MLHFIEFHHPCVLKIVTPMCPYLTVLGIAQGFEKVLVEARMIILEASDKSSAELPGIEVCKRQKPWYQMHRLPPVVFVRSLVFFFVFLGGKFLFFGGLGQNWVSTPIPSGPGV